VKNLLAKLKESCFAVLPIAAIVMLFGLTMAKFDTAMTARFLIGSVFVIIGMSLFSLGADVAMLPMGSSIGANLTKTKKLWVILVTVFILGVLITIAEPDLLVLGVQLSKAVSEYVLIVSVGVGVGLLLIVAVLRLYFNISLRLILFISYGIVFTLAIVLQSIGRGAFVPLSFDSGGVTTGPMTVPFILALGVGVASLKGGSNADDSFGFIGIASVGPIIAVMVLGFFADMSHFNNESFQTSYEITGVVLPFFSHMPDFMLEVTYALVPILAFFLFFNFVKLKLSKKAVTRVLVGVVYIYVGLVVFLTGVNIGFSPAGALLGQKIVEHGNPYLLIPIGMLLGFFIVLAEPAVHVLNAQVEEVSGGAIKKIHMMFALMIGMSIAVGLGMLRVAAGINILWIVVPWYAVSLALSFYTPKVFTAIAFDSGGVASGPMTATFLMPFAIGGALAGNKDILMDAFGVVAMVAMTPLLVLQVMGVITKLKTARLAIAPAAPVEGATLVYEINEDIIDFDKEEP